jgi:hypothetical protein
MSEKEKSFDFRTFKTGMTNSVSSTREYKRGKYHCTIDLPGSTNLGTVGRTNNK